jgi:hypothetical protein
MGTCRQHDAPTQSYIQDEMHLTLTVATKALTVNVGLLSSGRTANTNVTYDVSRPPLVVPPLSCTLTLTLKTPMRNGTTSKESVPDSVNVKDWNRPAASPPQAASSKHVHDVSAQILPRTCRFPGCKDLACSSLWKQTQNQHAGWRLVCCAYRSFASIKRKVIGCSRFYA